MSSLPLKTLCVVIAAFHLVLGQIGYPHDYPGKPNSDFSPVWQDCETSISHLLADDSNNEPWGIWLNGGPGSSSLLGFFTENGPLHVRSNYSIYANEYSWDHLADYIWVDQPVGTGFSTVDATGFVADEDQMGEDFFRFLENLVKIFPSLRTRPLYLTGESYSGRYIPYITKTYFGLENPPVKLTKIAIGDGTIGNIGEYEVLPAITIIETYPQLIGYDPAVFEYFKELAHLCGLDLNLTYPQDGYFPTLNPLELPDSATAAPTNRILKATKARRLKRRLVNEAMKLDALASQTNSEVRSLKSSSRKFHKREQWKRDLSGRANGTIDPWYGCDLYDEVVDYALNFSLPWKNTDHEGFDVHDIPDALVPEAVLDASVFLNNHQTRAAIHAPTSKNWMESIFYPFNNTGPDPSVEPMAFLSELATNASQHHIGIVIYSGNDDSLVSHMSSEVAIQNTTFGGIQGFTKKPSTPWYDDEGDFAGIVHQERNWTYVLVKGAGHLVPQQQPERAYVLLREFILGNNQTGLVTEVTGDISVVGGEDPALAAPALPGQLGIYVGSATTQSTYTYPSLTIAAWESFIATATAISPRLGH